MSVEKLRIELQEAARMGLKNLHIDWGPEGLAMTPDERAAVYSKLLADSMQRHKARLAEVARLEQNRSTS